MLTSDGTVPTTKYYHRHLDRSPTVAQVGISCLQIIPLAPAYTNILQPPPHIIWHESMTFQGFLEWSKYDKIMWCKVKAVCRLFQQLPLHGDQLVLCCSLHGNGAMSCSSMTPTVSLPWHLSLIWWQPLKCLTVTVRAGCVTMRYLVQTWGTTANTNTWHAIFNP